MTDIKNGLLGVGELDTDFLLGTETSVPPLVQQDNIRIEYSQGETNHCTLYGPIGAVSDLTNYQFTVKDIKEIIKMSVDRGKPIDQGRYTQSGVKCVCDRWNTKYPDKKLLFFRMDLCSQTFWDVLSKGYTIVVSYRGNSDYGNDIWDDAIVEGTVFLPSTYGHCTCTITLEGGNVVVTVKDNYKGRTGKGGISTNLYKLKDLQGLLDSGCYYKNCYFFIPELATSTTEDQLKRLTAFKNQIDIAVQAHSNMWGLTNEETFKNQMHERNNILREKLVDITREINKL